jgi:hypothetical protein
MERQGVKRQRPFTLPEAKRPPPMPASDRPTVSPNVYWQNNQVYYHPIPGMVIQLKDLYTEGIKEQFLSYALHVGAKNCVCIKDIAVSANTIWAEGRTNTLRTKGRKCPENALIIVDIGLHFSDGDPHSGIAVINQNEKWYYLFNPWGTELDPLGGDATTETLIMYTRLDEYFKQTYGSDMERRTEFCSEWQGDDELCNLWAQWWMFQYITTGHIPRLSEDEKQNYTLRTKRPHV